MPEREKKRRFSWLKTAAGSAVLAIVGWEAVRWYRGIREEKQPEKNPDPLALPSAAPGFSAATPQPLINFPMLFPPSVPPPPAAVEPARNTAPDYSAKELARMLRARKAYDKQQVLLDELERIEFGE